MTNKKSKSKKKKFLKKAEIAFDEIFGKYNKKEINRKDIEDIIKNLNDIIQEYAHTIKETSGLIPHVERKLIKKEIKKELLKLLSHYHPDQVVEYLLKNEKD